MEVVVLLVAIVGVALLAIPRLQRWKAGARRPSKPRKRVSTPVVAAAAVPASSAAAWAPPEGSDVDAWEDDLGWEGEAEPAPEALEAWEDWRAAALPSAAASSEAPAAEPELPSVERWRTRAEDDDWVEDDDDGLGWEGEDEAPPARALWNGNGNGHAPAPTGYDAGSSDFNGSRDWSRAAEPAPAPASAPAFATASATDVAAPAPGAPISDPELGRSIEAEPDAWDPPITRTWGAASTPKQAPPAPAKAAPRRSGTRSRVHPVLLVALYAAVGIGLVVLASTVLLGGSADPKPAAKKQQAAPRATATVAATATATPVATATPTPDPAIAAAAQSDFTRERANAVRSHKAALADAVAAAKREAKAKKARANHNKKPAAPSGNGGGGTNYTPPVATYTPPASNPAPAAQKPKKRSVCEFCIG